MAQFVVRNIETGIKLKLQRRAKRNGRSMEEEIRDILRNAVNDEGPSAARLGTEISALFAEAGLDRDIPEMRGYGIEPPSFEE